MTLIGKRAKSSPPLLCAMVREKEKVYLSQKLEDLGGNVGLTAKKCRIGVRTLSRKIQLHGLDKKIFKEPTVLMQLDGVKPQPTLPIE